MNTEIQVEGALFDPVPWFERLESLWSRFDPESALSQLNRMAGRWVVVPPLLHLAVRRALAAAAMTCGAFDPTVLPALVSAGYGRSFEQGPTQPGRPVPAGRWRDVKLAPGAVYLPQGVQLDLGGIGKGLAADLLLRRMRRAGAEGERQMGQAVHAGRSGGSTSLLVNAGGDLALWTSPEAPPWLVDVEDPFQPDRTLATFALHQGAVATSSTLGRCWGEGLHHIIDPSTGRPSQSELVSATIFAGRAAQADVLAKACIILGVERGLALLANQGCHGLLVTAPGDLTFTPGLEEFLHASAE